MPEPTQSSVSDKYCSDIVDAAHDIFVVNYARQCEEVLEKSYPHFPTETKNNIIQFAKDIKNWLYFREVEDQREKVGIHAFTQELEIMVYRLCAIKKKKFSSLTRYHQSRQASLKSVESLGYKITRIKDHLAKLPKDSDELTTQQQKLETLEKNLEKEHTILHKERVDAEISCKEISEKEEQLIEYIEKEAELRDRCLDLREDQNIAEDLAVEIYGYSIDNRFYTYVTAEDWKAMLEEANMGMREKMKSQYDWDEDVQAHKLKLDQHYHAAIEEDAQLIGEESTRSGSTVLNPIFKPYFDHTSLNSTFKEDKEDVGAFFSFIVAEALADGIMSVNEIKKLLELSKALNLTKLNSIDILDKKALLAQRRLVKDKLKNLFSVAMEDNEIHKDEQNIILELQKLMLKSMEPNLSSLIYPNPDQRLNLIMEDEDIFVEMCRAAMADNLFSSVEKTFVTDFAKRNGWSKEKMLKLITRVKEPRKGF
jgi:hypothetical protein